MVLAMVLFSDWRILVLFSILKKKVIIMNMAEKIKFYRQRKNLTQEKLAELIGVSAMTVKRWEWGQRIPRANELMKLAQALNTNMEYLMGQTDMADAPEDKTPDEKNNLPINNTPENENASEKYLDLGYWGTVAENAKRAAKFGNSQELSLVAALLQSAVDTVKGAGIITGAESNSTPKFVNIQSGSNNKNNMSVASPA